MDFDINFQPVQAKLYDMYEFGKETRIGFGGSRGGAKSHTSDILMLLRRFKYPKTNGLFVMKVYQDMMDIHIRPMLDAFYGLSDFFNKQDMILNLPNGSYVRFLSGDNLATFQQRKGRGFADVMVDQSELFTEAELKFLFTINRSVDPNIVSKSLLCFNPGNIGHTFHKRIFYEKVYEGNEHPEDYAFLQTFGWDNAYWCLKPLAEDGLTMEDYHKWDSPTRFDYFIKRSEYGRNLDQLPEAQRKAELLGDMDIFEGMFFSDFRRPKHVIETGYEHRPTWNTVGGLDYGNTTVLEVLQRDYEGNVIVEDECYLPDCETPGERANAIADFLLERKLFRLKIIYDTDMEISQISNVGYDKTPIQIFRKIFTDRMGLDAPVMIVVNKRSLDRHKGYREMANDAIKEYLHINKETNEPKLFFFSKCKYLIKEVSTLIYPPDDSDGRDYLNKGSEKPHCIDGFKYGFLALYAPILPKPKPIETPRAAAHTLATRPKSISRFR